MVEVGLRQGPTPALAPHESLDPNPSAISPAGRFRLHRSSPTGTYYLLDLYRSERTEQMPSVARHYLFDLSAGTLTRVRQPGLGYEWLTHLSAHLPHPRHRPPALPNHARRHLHPPRRPSHPQHPCRFPAALQQLPWIDRAATRETSLLGKGIGQSLLHSGSVLGPGGRRFTLGTAGEMDTPFRVSRRFLIAPDKFKGSLSATEAAVAIAAGVRRADPEAEVDLCPIADGGEGFMATLAVALGGRWVTCPAVDALDRPIASRYVLADTPEGLTAIMEMAETAGISRLAADERDPLAATTKGTGQQIAHAVREHRVARIILGIGGSATNDGGSGMAAALGWRFLDGGGLAVEPTPATLPRIVRLDASDRLALPEIIAACDVDNPLLGERGATAVFSAQKGSTAETRPLLEAALERLVGLSDGRRSAATPGAGAAGGLGFGLLHFTRATLLSGFDLVADLLRLAERVAAADHVLTGEGALDHQSLAGKGPVGLARMAAEHGVPVTAFCGMTDDVARDSGLFQSIHALADSGLPLETLIAEAAPLLADLVAAADPGHSPNPIP